MHVCVHTWYHDVRSLQQAGVCFSFAKLTMPPRYAANSRGWQSDASSQFHKYFTSLFGDRWKQLSKALVAETSHVALLNSFAGAEALQQVFKAAGLQSAGMFQHGLIQCYRRVEDFGSYPPPQKDSETGLRTHYWLDAASLLPPVLLNCCAGHKVLDMAAAPGGKTLLLAMQLFSGQLKAIEHLAKAQQPPNPANEQPHSLPGFKRSQLVANEMDQIRCKRLQAVLTDYLPLELLSGSETPAVRVTNYAADKHWQRHEEEVYDRVLLDAPCSSDRHILQQAAKQRGVISPSDWSEAGCKKIASLQSQLLLAGIKALAPGGMIVYSTCSLATVENDAVVAAALSRLPPGCVEVLHPLQGNHDMAIPPHVLKDVFGAEPTQHGMLVMPDVRAAGPMYVAVLSKKQSAKGLGPAAMLGLQRLALHASQDSDDDSSCNSAGNETLVDVAQQ